MAYNFSPPPSPCTSFADITKSDTTLLTGLQWIYVGGTGDLVLKSADGTTTGTFKAVPVGTFIPFGSGYVMAASTTTLLVACR